MSAHDVYDLGEIRATAPEAAMPAMHGSRRVAGRTAGTHAGTGAAFAPRRPWVESLSLFAPGAGQIGRGEFARGIGFFSATGFFVAVAWALHASIDRLAATLELFGSPAWIAVWALGGAVAMAALVHLWNVLDVVPLSRHAPKGATPHPALAGAASAILPGWGQVLNGTGWRAIGCLIALAFVGTTWLFDLSATRELLAAYRLELPSWTAALTAPAVRWTVPAVIWALAVYDAVATAARRR